MTEAEELRRQLVALERQLAEAQETVRALTGGARDVKEQKAAEAALRESQQLLEEAQRVAHLGSWSSATHPDGAISWSTECARIFGRDVNDPPSANAFLQMVHVDDRARVIAASQAAIATGGACETEHRIVLPGGEVRWVHARALLEGGLRWSGESAEGTPDTQGSGYRAVGVVQDITSRKVAEALLLASESRYRRMVENTSEGVWLYDAEGVTTFMNARLAAMLGCTVEEAVGQSIFAFMDAATRVEGHARLARRKLGMSERGELRLTRRDGTDLWVSLRADPLLDPAGNFDGAFALVTDITERRKADEIRSRLASIVASSDDAIISRGADGIIRTWNRGAERLTQYAAEEAVGKPISILYPPEQAARIDAERERIDTGAILEQVEMVIVRKDGSPVEISLTSSVLTDDDGSLGASIIARDVTERKRAEAALRLSEEQLRQAQKMEAVGNLAGGVAHDFNNLLSVILGYTNLIVESLRPIDPLRADLEEVQKAALRATEVTRQLLAFSRRQVLQPAVLELNQVVSGIRKMFGRLLGEDIELTVLTSPVAGKIYADPGQIEQVIMNLVVNARDAMPRGGSLTIETANVTLDESYAATHLHVVPGAYVLLAVTDTGSGMEPATQERIFEPFFTTKDKSKGTGLGLSTVYGIVQQSGGHIWVYSEPGKGTTFKIYLPRTDRAVESLLPHEPPAATLRGTETLLLVEDDEQVRTIMRAILRKQGYHVLEAQNGGEAFLLCEQFTAKIDLMITDVVMPRMSGRQLAERLVGMRPSMRVLYVSGYTEDTIVHHGVLDSGVEFLQKPIMPGALMRKVRELLDSPPPRAGGS